MKNPTIILGAGLTGLGCAKNLPDSVIYEANDHPGGHVYSHEQNGICFDEGAHICHARDEEWLKLLYKQAGDVVRIEQSKVSNYWHGHWLTYPVQNHLRDLPSELRILALDNLVRAQMDNQGKTPANYEEWCRYQYGDFLTDRFYREYTDKYWRTSMAEMGTDWLAGRLLPSQLSRIIHGSIAPHDEKQSVFSLFHYPKRGGFFSFFRGLYEGADVRLNKPAVSLDVQKRMVRFADGETTDYKNLVSTIPLTSLVRITENATASVLEAASGLRCTQLMGVNIIIKKPDLSPHHWFYIYDSDIDVSRVKVTSNVTPDSVPRGSTVLQTELFVRDDESFDVERQKEKAVRDMGRILGFDPVRDVQSVGHIIVKHAYPIPTIDRQERTEHILAWYEQQGIYPAGLFGRWKYMWSDQAFASGKAMAEKLKG